MLDYMLFHRGLPTTPAVQVMAAFRTDPALADPDIILSMLPVAVTFNDKGDAVVEKRPSFSFGFHVARPESRGGIRLRSADSDAKPLIYHRLQSAASDVAKLVKTLKIVEGICRTRELYDIVPGTLRTTPLPETAEHGEAHVRRGERQRD